ncbi:baculoviral IAP repeat-containing protein 3-like [Dermacentor andersoni]|uniref:baculoviral IAP repeat-containing protein 3-like n=1 Tax=Dermacentor andersoni TaxID=34620 RepID=UPI003B3AB71E
MAAHCVAKLCYYCCGKEAAAAAPPVTDPYNVELLKNSEKARTFVDNWPHPAPPPLELARAGFYYVPNQEGDTVRGPSCSMSFSDWKVGDIPPCCCRHSDVEPPPRRFSMATMHARLQTFVKWRGNAEFGVRLAKAGFYYSGDKDHTICFYCD